MRVLPLYEIWMSEGRGMKLGPRFRLLHDAERYIEEHRGEASLAVKSPDGKWEMIASRRRMARGTLR